MTETAVADTGPLLHLTEIGEVGRLEIFETVLVTAQVGGELTEHGIITQVTDNLGNRFRIRDVSRNEMQTQLTTLLRFKLHQTDLSTAALAARIKPDVVLTDDLELRRALEAQNVPAVGSIGILFRALKTGQLSKRDAVSRLNQLLNDSSLYTSKALRVTVRRIVDDLPD